MNVPMKLLTQTPPDWADYALQDFDHFLIDHASCERKASAVGMSFVVRYPDRQPLLQPMIQFAREELEHFHQVYKLIEERGLSLQPDEEDEYVSILMKAVRTGREERLLDRLLVSGLIEARGCERLTLIAEKLTDPKLKSFYSRLARAEAHHHTLFIDLAETFFSKEVIDLRMQELLQIESNAIQSVPYRHALH
jgi:tRNA-(ms[2]io[6]A)-hydroxylase